MPADTWSASQYVKFEDERTRPSRDLIARVPLAFVASAVDVGCGPGNSTEVVASRYPGAEITGVDSSADMLAAARKRLPSATFVQADVGTWSPSSPVDLIFANAVLQWVPHHLDVAVRLMQSLKPGGVLAVQVPDNDDEPSHVAMRAVAAEPAFAPHFHAPIEREEIPAARTYYDRLKPHAASVDIWRTTYQHVLADAAAVVEWLRGTGLRPYVDRLPDSERPRYLARYQSAVAAAYPPQADGRVLFPFPRLFLVAVKR